MEAFLLKLLIYLAAATIAVPIARKCRLGSVLGYLIAGIVIGPFGLSLIDDIEAVMRFTEFGVVMMLFLIGLELKPSLLWQMRTPILGMGGSQVLVTSAAIGLSTALILPWRQAVAIGLILALSSTAVDFLTSPHFPPTSASLWYCWPSASFIYLADMPAGPYFAPLRQPACAKSLSRRPWR